MDTDVSYAIDSSVVDRSEDRIPDVLNLYIHAIVSQLGRAKLVGTPTDCYMSDPLGLCRACSQVTADYSVLTVTRDMRRHVPISS